MSTPEERIERAALDDIREMLGWQTAYWARRYQNVSDSPIERLFSMALGAIGFARRPDVQFCEAEDAESIANEHAGCTIIAVYPQMQARKYRVDFVLSCYRVAWDLKIDEDRLFTSRIAVECDGFAYHHGNAALAAKDKARDRELAEIYDAVIRFTGSELHANAYACALQAIKVAEAKLR